MPLSWRIPPFLREWLYWLEIAFTAVAYVAGAQVGFFLAFLHSQVSPVWPPEGISLALVLLRGYRILPGVFLGAFIANFLHNPHLPTALLIGAGNTTSVLWAAYFSRRSGNAGSPFSTVRRVLHFLTVGSMPGALISAALGVTSLYIYGFVPDVAYWNVLLTWWTGEMQGLIIVAPFIYTWSQRPRIALAGWRSLEALFLTALLVLVSILVFQTKFHLTYVPIPLIVWAIFRFRLHGAVTAISIVSFTSIYFTINHRGPFAIMDGVQLSLNSSLLLLELYIGALTVMTMLLAATIAEREEFLKSQQAYAQDLARERNTFRRFVPGQFLEILGKKTAHEIDLGDSIFKKMTVLFSDMRSFSRISELLTPHQNIELINSYLSLMEPAINRQHGFVDKFIGDAIMALFDDAAHKEGGKGSADLSVAAALEMRQELAIFNEVRRRKNFLPIDVGIGISTGPLVLGTVGSTNRLDTTVIGDTVNLAARIESLTAHYNLPVLISGETAAELREFRDIRRIDRVAVRGRLAPVDIFEALGGDEPEVTAAKIENGKWFGEAFELYLARNFEDARKILEQTRIRYEEGFILLFLARIEYFLQKAPPDNWDGTEKLGWK
ncbi:MAG: MASE1 domain-containing protein [Spirochaetales bacterium]|nr:MASE1 domain-containing protein [Spirochaetales bacterium]